MEEIFHADRERKSTGTLFGYSVRLQYCIAESSLNRIHSVFIQSVIRAGNHPVSATGSSSEKERAFCLRQQAGTTNRSNLPQTEERHTKRSDFILMEIL